MNTRIEMIPPKQWDGFDCALTSSKGWLSSWWRSLTLVVFILLIAQGRVYLAEADSDHMLTDSLCFCLRMIEVWVMTVCVDDNKDRAASPFSSCLSKISDWSTDELPVFTNEPGH